MFYTMHLYLFCNTHYKKNTYGTNNNGHLGPSKHYT